VNDRFIELLTKELSDTLTADEQQEFNTLLETSSTYRKQREILKDYWKRDATAYTANVVLFKKIMSRIQAEEETATEDVILADTAQRSNRSFRHFMWYSAAAVLLMVGTVAYYYLTTPKPQKVMLATNWQQNTTKIGVRKKLILTDGTVVTLNSATTFRYPATFGAKTREVYLNGEAYFDVHKDHQHPFIIHTNKMNIRVLGTAFNVKSYQSEPLSETTLIRGSIEVTLNDRPNDRIILKPKEKLILQNNTFTKSTTNISTPGNTIAQNTGKGTQYALTNLTYLPNHDSLVVETSWMFNKLIFRNEDFGSIANQMERWYGISIVFKKEELKTLRFTAMFENETVLQALDALRGTEDFHYKLKNSVIYIY
jgi:transmembrane sensor